LTGRLGGSGTSHRKLLDEVRREPTIRLLEEGQLTIAAVPRSRCGATHSVREEHATDGAAAP
jgi:hypothetical protein